MGAFFKIPLNLPHAGTIAHRIALCLDDQVDWNDPKNQRLKALVRQLQELLIPYREEGENPAPAEAKRARDTAAELGRALVDQIEALGLGGDRLGQCVRNLFECLELGEEGAAISLRAGENPASVQRPA